MIKSSLSLFFLCCVSLCIQAKVNLTTEQKTKIGMHIWHNEASKRRDLLVFWNINERFPSLGICHFIWFPKNCSEIYTQTFPDLLHYFKKKKVKLPIWLAQATYAPWQTREEFLKQEQGFKIEELRTLMFETMDVQVEFLIERLKRSWIQIRQHAPASKLANIEYYFNKLTQSPRGMYALLDYLNFKGEGVSLKERYNNIGWGLLQVLETMVSQDMQGSDLSSSSGPHEGKRISNAVTDDLIKKFVIAAQSVLTARVDNAPPSKAHEKNWLKGWCNRLNTYTTFF